MCMEWKLKSLLKTAGLPDSRVCFIFWVICVTTVTLIHSTSKCLLALRLSLGCPCAAVSLIPLTIVFTVSYRLSSTKTSEVLIKYHESTRVHFKRSLNYNKKNVICFCCCFFQCGWMEVASTMTEWVVGEHVIMAATMMIEYAASLCANCTVNLVSCT